MTGYPALNQDTYRRLDWAHGHLAPVPTDFVVVYENDDGRIAVITPAPAYVAALMHGGLVRDMRVSAAGFEGNGAMLPAMTEQQAIEFIAWKDVPLAVQAAHANGNRARIAICRTSQLPDRKFRDAWRWQDAE